MRGYTFDRIGDIVIFKFPENAFSLLERKKIAKQFLKENPSVKTALEKTDRVKGRLRKIETEWLAGINTREALYLENGCKFKLNVDEAYFSPRLAYQRQKVAEDIARRVTIKKNKILVMFAGVAPFPIVIAKKLKQAGKKAFVISSEINRIANKYAEENVKLNKLQEYVHVIPGDSRRLGEKLEKNVNFDFIFMARPNLQDTFIKDALKLAKEGARIYYHGFGTKEKVLAEIKKDAGNKIGKIEMQKAGEIAPYKNRWMAVFEFK